MALELLHCLVVPQIRDHPKTKGSKTLGLALVAALALSAVAASGASAAKFTSGSSWTVLKSKGVSATQSFHESELGFTCNEVNFTGSVGTEQETITVAPSYSGECKVSGFTLQVDPNGCHYLFNAAGSMSIQCPEGKSIEFTAFILGAFRKCLDISAQTPTTPNIHLVNETEITGGKNVWDVKLVTTAQGITYTKTGSCGEGTFHKLTDTGSVTIWGTDTAGNPVDVTWDA